MSANPTRTLEGTQAPAPFELLWERYRSLILTVAGAALAALLIHYGVRYFNQKAENQKWSAFVASLNAADLYTDVDKAQRTLAEALAGTSLETLQQSLQAAAAGEKPFYLLAIARKAMSEKSWDVAERALADLETGYPQHSFVVKSAQPVQSRDPEKKKDEEPQPVRKKQEWKPAKAGSVVSLMRDQLAAERAFSVPSSFAMPEIPADATKVRFELGDRGSFVIALMPQAPLLKEAFLALVKAEEGAFWKGIAVDEIQRPTKAFEQARKLHLGYPSTKSDNRDEWSSTEESQHQVSFEETGLSHFPGAVAANPGTSDPADAQGKAQGKACADRFWINVDDLATQDGTDVVFGYVVEGLDVLKRICESGLQLQDEDRGAGRPTETIRVTAVEVLQ